jgi:predicted kinase
MESNMKTGCVHIIYGPIGSGKTTLALEKSRYHKVVKFSSDKWFRNLYMDDMHGIADMGWVKERIARCEFQIWHVAKQSLDMGADVIFDFGLAKKSDRMRLYDECQRLNYRCRFYYLSADVEVRRDRVVKRNQGLCEAFEFVVSPEMFEATNRMFEEPDEQELRFTKTLST